MMPASRRGEISKLQIIVLVILIIAAGLFFQRIKTWVSPPPIILGDVIRVEALEVMNSVMAVTKNGQAIDQTAALGSGGSSRLVATRPAASGDYVLIPGTVSFGFLKEKIGMDRMLLIKVDKDHFKVLSGDKPVPAIVVLPRTEKNPLRVIMPSVDIDVDPMSLLFTNQTIQPVPAGKVSKGSFKGNSGLTVTTAINIGKQGYASQSEGVQFEFTLDDQSSAWVEMPNTIAYGDRAVGGENVGVGFLIRRDVASTEPYDIYLVGERVATVPRP